MLLHRPELRLDSEYLVFLITRIFSLSDVTYGMTCYTAVAKQKKNSFIQMEWHLFYAKDKDCWKFIILKDFLKSDQTPEFILEALLIKERHF